MGTSGATRWNSSHNSSGTSRSTILTTTDSLPRQPIEMASKDVYFQDSGSRATGLSDVTLNDIDYLDLDY